MPQARASSLPLTDEETVALGIRKESKRRETGLEAPKVLFGLSEERGAGRVRGSCRLHVKILEYLSCK